MTPRLAVAALLAAAPLAAQSVQTLPAVPQQAGWRTWVAPADRIAGRPDSAGLLQRMPPGWHVTTGPRTLIFEDYTGAADRFRVDTEFFFFPGPAESWLGLVVGGRELGTPQQSGLVVLLRRDGQAALHRFAKDAHDVLVDWSPASGAVVQRGDSVVKNLLAVSVEADSLRVTVNGQRALAVAAPTLRTSGNVAFLAGRALNAHITTLDIVFPKAPRR